MGRWLLLLLLVGCGPSVGIVESTSESTGPAGTTTTGPDNSTSSPDDSTDNTTGSVQPGSTGTGTSAAGSDSSTGCVPDMLDDDAGDTGDSGECSSAGSPGGYMSLDGEGGNDTILDVDDDCPVIDVLNREPGWTDFTLMCSEPLTLTVHADPPVPFPPEFAVGQTVHVRAYRAPIGLGASFHTVVRALDGSLLAARYDGNPVPTRVDPDFLAWFSPLTFAAVDLGCDPVDPPNLCGFIEDPCASAHELRAVQFSDGTDETLVHPADAGLLGPFDLRARTGVLHPTRDNDCFDEPQPYMSWTAFRVQ